MHRILDYRPSPALVVAFIALFVALGGVSYGLASGSINSREIKNNTIKSRDVRNGFLLGKDLRRGTVGSREVAESKLRTVPSAGRVDGHSLARIDWRVPAGTPTRTILNFGGLIVNATCTGGGDLNLTATTSVNNAMVHVSSTNLSPGNASYADSNDLDIGENVNAVPTRDTRVKNALTYVAPTGSIVDVSYMAQEQTNGLGSANDCFVTGRASVSPG